MTLFTFVQEQWPKDALRENIKSSQAKGCVKLNKQIYVLTGNEDLELLIFWELDYEIKMTKDKNMTQLAKLNILKLLVKYDALC